MPNNVDDLCQTILKVTRDLNLLYLLEKHLEFIEWFYPVAAEPFETMKHKMVAEEEPFVPQNDPEDYDGPEYMGEWGMAEFWTSVETRA